MKFEVTILGTSAGVAMHGRQTSAQVVNVQDRLYMMDCGENTFVRFQALKFHAGNLNSIFISHLHGDHYFGLIGFLTSLSLLGRTERMDVFAPEGLQQITNIQLQYSHTVLGFPLHFHIVDTTKFQHIFEDKNVVVYSIPLCHRIPTTGFLLQEKPFVRTILSEKIKQYNLPFTALKSIKLGADYQTPEGEIIPNAELTATPRSARAYAYCSDTICTETIIPFIHGIDLLYHETTFCHDLLTNAEYGMHTTARQAAILAQKAGVKQLLTGHYSTRYIDIEPIIAEAKMIFPNTLAGEEKRTYAIPFQKRSSC